MPIAVGGDIAGHAGGLLAGVQAFDAEGVDHDVLRGRGGGHQHRAEQRRTGAMSSGSLSPSSTIAAIEQQLARTPASRAGGPAASRQHRHIERIDQRRPEEFDGVGQADQREQADGGEVDAALGQPHRQRRAGQRQRQAGGEAEQHHDQHARLEDRRRWRRARIGVGGCRGRGHAALLHARVHARTRLGSRVKSAALQAARAVLRAAAPSAVRLRLASNSSSSIRVAALGDLAGRDQDVVDIL